VAQQTWSALRGRNIRIGGDTVMLGRTLFLLLSHYLGMDAGIIAIENNISADGITIENRERPRIQGFRHGRNHR
jgi:hypothetical protein